MKRKIYQPHFTLSLHGVFNLCQAIGGSSRSTEHKLAMELGIDAILMNGPIPILSEMVLCSSCTAFISQATKSHIFCIIVNVLSGQGLCEMLYVNLCFVSQDKSRISMVVSWATSSIFWLYSNQRSLLEISCKEPPRNESLLSKILRLLVASVILGKISSIFHGKSVDLAGNTSETLCSFLDNAYERAETAKSCSVNDTLAVIILHLQDHMPKNSDSLPSVIAALCLLLLDRSSKQGRLGLFCTLIMKSSNEPKLIYQF
jgi:nucleolar pre-ribosomal-associated protein 1